MNLMLRFTLIGLLVAVSAAACSGGETLGNSITSEQLESFYKAREIDGVRAVALKKRSVGIVAFLATVHGFPDNLSVCEELIAPYNKGESKSDISGDYFCEELR